MAANFIILIINFLTLILVKGEPLCKPLPAIEDFEPEEVIGRWYLVTRNPSKYDIRLKCVYCNVTLDFPKQLVYHAEGLGAYYENIYHFDVYMEFVDKPSVADFKAFVKSTKFKDDIRNERIVYIDYNSYLILHACDGDNDLIWVLTRRRQVDQKALSEIYDTMEDIGLDWTALQITDQTDCTN